MLPVKFLERKPVIRLFGLALLLAPFVNTWVILSLHTEIPDRYNWTMFWKIVSSVSTAHHILDVFSIVVGLMMLRGLTSTWKFVLIVLGGNIALQLGHFERDVLKSWVSVVFFIVNVILFSFVSYQFVWKENNSPRKPKLPEGVEPEGLPVQSEASSQFAPPPQPPLLPPLPPQEQKLPPPPVSSPVSSPASSSAEPPREDSFSNMPLAELSNTTLKVEKTSSKQIPIHFDGFGPWAKLVSISKKEIHIRSTVPLPYDVSHRDLEFVLKNGLVLKAQMLRQSHNDYFFEFKDLNTDKIKLLNEWLLGMAA